MIELKPEEVFKKDVGFWLAYLEEKLKDAKDFLYKEKTPQSEKEETNFLTFFNKVIQGIYYNGVHLS